MNKKEKVRKLYQKLGTGISEEALEVIMKDKERLKGLMKLYKQEKEESMNYIFGKPESNKYFTEFELKVSRKIDLFNRKVVEICKRIYEKEYKEVNV